MLLLIEFTCVLDVPVQIIKKGIPKNGALIQVPGLWSSLKDQNKKPLMVGKDQPKTKENKRVRDYWRCLF